jgi:hypothetical protein
MMAGDAIRCAFERRWCLARRTPRFACSNHARRTFPTVLEILTKRRSRIRTGAGSLSRDRYFANGAGDGPSPVGTMPSV